MEIVKLSCLSVIKNLIAYKMSACEELLYMNVIPNN